MVVDNESKHDTWNFEVVRLQMISKWPLEALLCSPAPTTCSICQNILLQGMMSPLFQGFLYAIVKLKRIFKYCLCKGERLGMLTPNLVFSLILCGKTMLATFCINRDHKISFLSQLSLVEKDTQLQISLFLEKFISVLKLLWFIFTIDGEK